MSMKKILTTVPVAAMIGFAGITAVAAPASASSDWDRLAQCESGGNWSIDTGNSYYGGLQFSQQSWNAVGGTGNPAHASKAEQIQRGEKLRQIQGWGAWPSCSAQLGLSGAPSGNVAPEPAPQPAPAPQETAPEPAPQPVAEAPVVEAPVQQEAPVVEAPVETAPVASADTVNVPASDGETVYTIQSGDTLHEIAEKFDVEGGFNTLTEWNDNITDPNVIFVGQVITVS